jgi:hypothetical protein
MTTIVTNVQADHYPIELPVTLLLPVQPGSKRFTCLCLAGESARDRRANR